MENYKLKAVLLIFILFASFIPFSQITSSQELSGGVKLVDTTPFLFAEAKLWILSIELGAGLGSSNSASQGYDTGPIDFSLGGKVYPIELTNLSPYFGFNSIFSLPSNQGPDTVYGIMINSMRTFAGVEFDLGNGDIPLSAFGGGDYITTLTEGSAGFGWHLGVKYTFSF